MAQCRQEVFLHLQPVSTCLQAVRIPHEEHMLHHHFGRQWEEYCSRTWRLLPLIF